MNIQMDATGPKLSEAEVAKFEEMIGFSLPASYHAFLLQFNGGRPDPYHYLIPKWEGKESLVNDFFGILPGRYNDLGGRIKLLEGRLPRGFIPIADDPGGNKVLLSLDGPARGKVYFWDHENEPENPTDALEDYPNLYWLADDFVDFLDNLRDEDEL